jgi:hypothetical protein
MSIALIALILDQYLLGFILMIVTSFAFLPMVPKLVTIKNMNIADISEPLQLTDIFSMYFIPKLERTYGTHKALIIDLLGI